jgi:hypothetical protein
MLAQFWAEMVLIWHRACAPSLRRLKAQIYHAIRGIGRTIFPNDETHVDLTFIVSNEAIAAAQENKFFKDSFEYFIVGFVEYDFTFSREPHYRGFIYMMMRTDPDHAGWTKIIQPQDKIISRDDLVLTPWFAHDSFFAT